MAQHGRDFSLRSMYRIRAICGEVTLTGTGIDQILESNIKFQAFSPLVSFQFIRILNIPFLMLPPDSAAAKMSCRPLNMDPDLSSHQHENDAGVASTGFLSLDETRKLIPLAHSDANVALTPIVGVWVRLPSDATHRSSFCASVNPAAAAAAAAAAKGGDSQKRLLSSNFIHAACTRFLVFSGIQDRVFVADETFLLVIHLCSSLVLVS